MTHDPTAFMFFDALAATARAEHALRARRARTPLRRRAGAALVALGHRIGGTTPAPAAGHLHPVTG